MRGMNTRPEWPKGEGKRIDRCKPILINQHGTREGDASTKTGAAVTTPQSDSAGSKFDEKFARRFDLATHWVVLLGSLVLGAYLNHPEQMRGLDASEYVRNRIMSDVAAFGVMLGLVGLLRLRAPIRRLSRGLHLLFGFAAIYFGRSIGHLLFVQHQSAQGRDIAMFIRDALALGGPGGVAATGEGGARSGGSESVSDQESRIFAGH